MKSTTLLLSVATLSAGLIVSGRTRAEDWKPVGRAGFLGVGKTYEMRGGMFTGSGITPARSLMTWAREVLLTTPALNVPRGETSTSTISEGGGDDIENRRRTPYAA